MFQSARSANLPEMWHIVELSDNRVKQLWSGKPVLSLYLRREMSKDDDCRLIGSDQDGADEQLEMLQPCRIAIPVN